MNSRAEPLFQFIFDLGMEIETIIVFDAVISYYKDNELCQLRSEIQIVVQPNELVMYIIEFQKPFYKHTDKYSTADFYFCYTMNRPLLIYHDKSLLLSIIAAE